MAQIFLPPLAWIRFNKERLLRPTNLAAHARSMNGDGNVGADTGEEGSMSWPSRLNSSSFMVFFLYSQMSRTLERTCNCSGVSHSGSSRSHQTRMVRDPSLGGKTQTCWYNRFIKVHDRHMDVFPLDRALYERNRYVQSRYHYP
jgi:hypothetical protein